MTVVDIVIDQPQRSQRSQSLIKQQFLCDLVHSNISTHPCVISVALFSDRESLFPYELTYDLSNTCIKVLLRPELHAELVRMNTLYKQ